MKLLFVTFSAIDDYAYGAAMRSNHIREAMLQIGEVHTLIIHGGHQLHLDRDWSEHRIKRATYDRSGPSAGAWRQRARIREWVAQILREQPYDAIVARYVGMAFFVPWSAWPRLIIDADDIVKSVPAGAATPLRQRLRLWARNAIARLVVHRAGHVWYVNPLDARGLGTGRVSLLRNVVRIPPEARSRAQPVAGRILMVGLFQHPPNAQGLRWFADAVLPALKSKFPDVELHAVGKFLPGFDTELPAVHFHGFVDDLALEYDLASLVIAPIESGGGTQIKVIDALAHRRPLAVSAFAHAGFATELLPSDHLLVCRNEQEWIRHCSWVLSKPAEAEAMAVRGYQAVRAYGSDRLTSTIQETVQLLGERFA